MKTPLQLALGHVRSVIRNRGQHVEPPTWEELELIVDELDRLRAAHVKNYAYLRD